MKSMRHAVILDIIASQEIQTQEELAAALSGQGIAVTQATVSRDIKELRLFKVLSETGGYKYAQVDASPKGMTERFLRMFSEAVISINASGNLIVIKTLTGSANSACEAVDALHWPEILGSIAGDNTILIVARENADVQDLLRRFHALAKRR
jgi:transcriptional regulator of arginine metabolism